MHTRTTRRASRGRRPTTQSKTQSSWWRRGAAAGAIGLTALVTAGVFAVPVTAATPRVLTIGVSQDIDNLNPYSGVTVASFEIWTLQYDELLNLSPDGLTPIPELATAIPKPENGGKSWTYHLRKDAMWSDGKPLTSADVKYTIERVRDEQWSNFYSFVKDITTVETPDAYTVRVTTKQPNPQYPLLQTYILPKHIWEKYPDTKALENFDNAHPVTSGPFRLTEFKKGQFQRLVANPKYFGGKPTVDQIVYRVFDNEEAKAQALQNGEIDAASDLDPNLFNQVKADSHLTVHEADDGSFNQLTINTGSGPVSKGHPALKDRRVRQAIAHAIDKQALVTRVLKGHGLVGQSMNVALAPAFDLTIPKDKELAFDPKLARTMLDDAGYKDTNGDGIREMPDRSKPLRFTDYVLESSTTSQSAAQYIKGWLRDIGIAVDIKITNEDQLTPIENAGTFDLAQWAWTPYVDPDTMMSYLTCDQVPQKSDDGLYNDAFYCSKEYDRLYHAQQFELDRTKRIDLVKQAQQVFYDDAPYVVLYRVRTLQAYDNTKFANFFTAVPKPDGPIMIANNFLNYLPAAVPAGTVTTVATTTAPSKSSSSDSNTGVIVVVVVLVVVVLGGGGLLLRRRRSADDRE